MRGISQRELAEIAGVPRSTVHRIEAGTSDPRLSTLDALLDSIGIELAAHIGGKIVAVDAERDQLVDVTGRHFPAHWQVRPVEWIDDWWGWWRKNPRVGSYPPSHTYWRRWGRQGVPGAAGLAWLWDDAT